MIYALPSLWSTIAAEVQPRVVAAGGLEPIFTLLRGENADAEQGRETETGSRQCGRQERVVHVVGL